MIIISIVNDVCHMIYLVWFCTFPPFYIVHFPHFSFIYIAYPSMSCNDSLLGVENSSSKTPGKEAKGTIF